MYLFKAICAIISTSACLIMSTPTVQPDNRSLLQGEWRKYNPEGTYLIYEKYVFRENGEALYSEMYIDSQELNQETREYRVSDNVLTIGLKKLIGSGKEYYRYRIISITKDEMILQLLSKYLATEPEKWVRPHPGH